MDQEAARLENLESKLSEDEKSRASRFHFSRDRDRFVASRGILRELLGKYIAQDPGSLLFRYGPRGKPELDSKFNREKVCFNLSHTNGLAAYAFARDRQLGIDIETISVEFPGDDIAGRFFSESERDQLFALPEVSRNEAFFLAWTRKEAYIKARGEGMEIRLDSFDVSLRPGQTAEFLRGVSPDWQVFSFRVNDMCPGALVYNGWTATEINLFRLPITK